MKCPKCGSIQTRVYESRYYDDDTKRLRRRECECGNRFATIEVVRDDFRELRAAKEPHDYRDRLNRIAQIVNEAPQFQ